MRRFLISLLAFVCAQAGEWHRVYPVQSPSPRMTVMAMTPDGPIAFGGWDGRQNYGDTWIYLAEELSWLKLNVPGPIPRTYTAMAATPAGALLFGGVKLINGGPPTDVYKDTWLYADGAWKYVLVRQSPPAVWGHAMAYNASDATTYIYGGNQGHGELWGYSGGSWRHLGALVFGGQFYPVAATVSGLAYFIGDTDGINTHTWRKGESGGWVQGLIVTERPMEQPGVCSTIDGLVLFGGGTAYPSLPLNVTRQWSWISDWRTVESTEVPKGRQAASMVYDAERRVVVMFGGVDAAVHFVGDTWEFW